MRFFQRLPLRKIEHFGLVVFNADSVFFKSDRTVTRAIVAAVNAYKERTQAPTPNIHHVNRLANAFLMEKVSMAQILSELCPTHPEDVMWLPRAIEYFDEAYKIFDAAHTELFPGVEETLASLSEAATDFVVISERDEDILEVAIDQFNLNMYFNDVEKQLFGRQLSEVREPALAKFYKKILPLYPEMTPEGVLMVSGLRSDKVVADQAGTGFCWAECGHSSVTASELSCSVDLSISSLPELCIHLSLPTADMSP